MDTTDNTFTHNQVQIQMKLSVFAAVIAVVGAQVEPTE
jgi:translation elongation factor EF-1beta